MMVNFSSSFLINFSRFLVFTGTYIFQKRCQQWSMDAKMKNTWSSAFMAELNRISTACAISTLFTKTKRSSIIHHIGDLVEIGCFFLYIFCQEPQSRCKPFVWLIRYSSENRVVDAAFILNSKAIALFKSRRGQFSERNFEFAMAGK